MFYKIPPINASYERNENNLPKLTKMQEIKENDNENEEEFSDILIDTMVNSAEYSAVDLANVIMNHSSSEILFESLKRNIAKNKALIINSTKTDSLIKMELVDEYNKAIVADAYISLKRAENYNIC